MYLSVDGDNTGKKLESYILNGNLKSLKKYSTKISNLIDKIEKKIVNIGGEVYLSGGDNILAYLPDDKIQYIIDSVTKINKINSINFSMGYSSNLKSTYLALKYAKSFSTSKIVCAKKERDNINFKVKLGGL